MVVGVVTVLSAFGSFRTGVCVNRTNVKKAFPHTQHYRGDVSGGLLCALKTHFSKLYVLLLRALYSPVFTEVKLLHR